MEIINLDKNKNYKLPENCALCLGMFDGVHQGHQALLNQAKNSNSLVAALTFTSSPKFVLNNRLNSSLITPITKRLQIFESFGTDIVLTKDFTLDFASMPPEVFISDFLKKLNPSSLVVGFDYRFGKFGAGDISLLNKHFKTYEVAAVVDNNGKISSTRIINDLQNGNISDVNMCLGRPYEVDGLVVHGFKNGKKINFPTANIKLDEEYYLPRDGVYIGQVRVQNKVYNAMLNVGKHPTIDELNDSIIEAHIIDFDEDIYNEHVSIVFLDFLREEKTFASFDDLKKELELNKKTIINYFKK
ncbi:MAG: bifunctional riboflavin kinase/FAD synthetase [Bacilli bacterium]